MAMARVPKARYTRKSKIHSVNMARAVLRPKRKERPATPAATDAEKALQAPAVQPPAPAQKNRTGFFRGLLSCAKYALPLIFSVYLAAFAVTWAQYEFAFNRQRQQLSIIGAMMAAGKAKDFAPLLAELTNRKLPIRPTLWDWEYIALTVFANQEPEKFSYYSKALMDDVAGLIRRIDDWGNADLSRIVLSEVNLKEAKLNGGDLTEANLTKADLREAYLVGADLTGADLTGAKLEWADLTRAYLSGSYLTEANLTGSYLTEANLTGSYLTEASLIGAKLTGANLTKANLRGAYLTKANLTEANLTEANLTEANLTEANLTEANLRKVNLEWANLRKADMTGAYMGLADMTGVDMTGAHLRKGNLTGTQMRWADLSGADLSGANLREANLYGADMTGNDLREAHLDGTVLSEADLSKIAFSEHSTKYTFIDDTCTDNDLIDAIVEILAKAKSLYKAKLPKPVREQLEKSHPHLFEEPKE